MGTNSQLIKNQLSTLKLRKKLLSTTHGCINISEIAQNSLSLKNWTIHKDWKFSGLISIIATAIFTRFL